MSRDAYSGDKTLKISKDAILEKSLLYMGVRRRQVKLASASVSYDWGGQEG